VETGGGVIYVRDFNKWKEFFTAPKKNSRTTATPKAAKEIKPPTTKEKL